MLEISEKTNLGSEYADLYLVYTRKSTDDSENQKNSIDYQVMECLKFAGRENLKVAPLSIDGFCQEGIIKEHHSGFKQDGDFVILPDGTVNQKVDRPKFLILAEQLKQRRFKGVIFLCWDRSSRNESDDLIIKKLIGLGLDVRFAQTTYDKSSSGALHMDIDGAFSRHYSRVISEKVKNTTNKLRNEGKCTYRSPIGYLDSGSDHKPFDPERAPIVKRIFEMYATGEWSYSTLAKWAHLQGLTTKPNRRNRTHSEKMSGVELDTIPKLTRKVTEKTIENILKNPFFIGKTMHKDEWIDSKAHQPLIDNGLFFKVQSLMKQKTVSVHYPEMHFNTYRGMICCALCKRAYSPYEQKGIIYYRSKCKTGCPNNSKNVNEDFINQKVQSVLDRISFTQKELIEIEAKAKTELNKVTTKRNQELEDLYRQMNKAMADLDYLAKEKLSLLRNQAMTMEEMRSEETRLSTAVEDIKTKIQANSESSKAMLDYIITFSELVKNASLYFKYALDSEKHELITQIFSELSINDGELKYKAKEGFSALLARSDDNFPSFGSPFRDRTFRFITT